MLSLSDKQMEVVQQAAAMLPTNNRDPFLRSVAGRLADVATPTDYDVATAVTFVLNTRGVSTPLYFNSGTKMKKPHAWRKDFSQRYGKLIGDTNAKIFK
jgi:hypothetical protein